MLGPSRASRLNSAIPGVSGQGSHNRSTLLYLERVDKGLTAEEMTGHWILVMQGEGKKQHQNVWEFGNGKIMSRTIREGSMVEVICWASKEGAALLKYGWGKTVSVVYHFSFMTSGLCWAFLQL